MFRPTMAHAVMVLAGLVTFVLVATVLRERSATVEVVVAAEDLPAGTPLTRASLALVAVDAGSALLGSLARPADLVDGVVLWRPVASGEPLLRSHLGSGASTSGRRTLALPVERLVVDGLDLRPGDLVDVVAVASDGSARYAVSQVEVARLPGSGPTGLGRPVETATTWLTVAVSRDEALALASAMGSGRVVVVRSTGADPAGSGGPEAGAEGAGPAGSGGAEGAGPAGTGGAEGAGPAGDGGP
jgi:Flp pilus assembly protein CpaB